MSSPQKHPKTGVFRLRKAVPKELQARVAELLGEPGKRKLELIRSLGTRDPREAKAAMPDALKWADGIIEAARSGPRPLTHEQIHALAGVWYQRKCAAFAASPSEADEWEGWEVTWPDYPHPQDPTEPGDGMQDTPAWHAAQARFLAPFLGMADDLLASEGVVTDAGSRQALAGLLPSRLAQALALHGTRRRGNYRPDPLLEELPKWTKPQDEAAKQKTAGLSLNALFDAWAKTATNSARTVQETRYTLDMLIKFLGHDDATRTGHADLLRWREAMKDEGRENNTWNNRLSQLRQVFARGVADKKLPSNPTDGLRLPKNKTKKRYPFSDEEAAKILNAARIESTPSLRWAHWVMAFTGMRAGEVLQLTRGDIREVDDVWCIYVNDDHPTKSVKTSLSRNVPIHSALAREGFLAYALAVPGDDPLFPDKGLDPYGKRGGRAWNLIGKWVRKKIGITDPLKAPDHSWRHRMEDEFRAVEVAEDGRDAIVGHARKTTGRHYGVRGEAIRRLARYIEQVPIPKGVKPLPKAPSGSP